MEKQKMIARLNEVLADEFEIEPSAIVPEANIKEILHLDSLSLVDMVALIESTFSVKIKGTEIVEIQTFGHLYGFLFERTGIR